MDRPFIVRAAFCAAFALALGLTPALQAGETSTQTQASQAALTPTSALQLLEDGNARFLEGEALERDYLEQVKATAGGQYPFGVVLGCIDSRVPPEIVFDQGVGDIFSARIAGNFVNTDILGSMEFAAAVAGSRVIVVLGHSECGAVKGACDGVQMGNLTHTLANLGPALYAVEGFEDRSAANGQFVAAVTEANVRLTTQAILDRSSVLRQRVESGELMVVGAIHDVATGAVTWLDGPGDASR